ncbi:hypothetical protein CUMW_105540 [Citrus unshiu]|uniref:Protein kinase domain-containing protein n=1 Tax=Citrus unshiu TaxID=55188 RepID=A0A2H5P5D3_CITUN|nr:hypothetical protein CUMW_105540 [Citrus unshiu]
MQCGQRLFLVDLSCHSGILLMAHVSYLMFFILSYLLLLSLAQEQMRFNLSCPSFSCGKFRNINFPYSIRTHPECGFCLVDDCDKPVQKIQLGKNEPWLSVTSISADQTVTLYDQVFQRHLDNRSCESFKNISLPGSPSISFEILSNLTLFKCPTILGNIPMNFNMSCDDSTIFYNHPDDDDLPSLPPQCSLIQLPVAASKTRYASDLFRLLTGNLSLKVLPNWRARRQCIDCPSRGGGQCLINSKGYLHCSNGIVATASYEESELNKTCPSFFPSCGNLGQFAFPFTDPKHPECGLMVVDNCNKLVQRIRLGKAGPFYNILNIAQDASFTLEDQVFQNHLGNSSCESFENLTLPNFASLSFHIKSNLSLFRCTHKLEKNLTSFHFTCNHSSFIYYNHPDDALPSILPPNCSLIQLPVNKTRKSGDLFNMLTSVFSLQVVVDRVCWECHWRGGQCQSDSKGNFQCAESRECNDCLKKRGHCHFDDKGNFQCENERTGHEKSELKLGLGLGGGSIVLIALLSFWIMFYRKFSSYDSTGSCLNIETFLRNHGSLAPRRYSYADIKKMTNSFKYKLGQGGYGSVYKGKLIDGRNVAVKVLNDSKGNGEEFINEVASISRTSHVNVVTLLGFCFEGRRRALIYEFVSSGSLEKFIYRNSSSIENHKLTWETLLQIAVGIARGLEYLHLGCSTRILHFDIKPHNILLDEDFWS